MVPSIVDIAGVNRIREKIFKEAVGAICGLVKMNYHINDAAFSQQSVDVLMDLIVEK